MKVDIHFTNLLILADDDEIGRQTLLKLVVVCASVAGVLSSPKTNKSKC